MFSSSTKFHVEQLMELGDTAFKLEMKTSRSFSAFGSASVSTSSRSDRWDFTTLIGMNDYLDKVKQCRMNINQLEYGW